MKRWSDIKKATLSKLFLEEEEASQQQYLQKFEYLANECLNIIANRVKPRIALYEVVTTKDNELITMPDDFISFADMIIYLDDEENPDIVYIGDRQILCKKAGTYKIFYNAEWAEITKELIDSDEVLEIDKSVLNCLPTYMASQLLSQDDVQRATILKNEFEMLLAGLDTNILYQNNHFKSVGGWY